MECLLRCGSRVFLLALVAGLVTPGVALSADNGLYIGAATSNVSSDYDVPGSFFPPDDDRGFKLIGGFRPLDSLAIEANYADFGTTREPVAIFCITTPCPTQSAIDAQA